MEQVPSLCEPGVRRMLRLSLKKCTQNRHRYYTVAFNAGMGLLAAAVVGTWLYARYRGRKSRARVKAERAKEHAHVIDKLRMYTALRKREQAGSELTGLPRWDELNR